MSGERTNRAKTVDVRWKGDEQTEAALLRFLEIDDRDAAPGFQERWMRIPARKAEAARKVLKDSGAQILKPEP